jgi:hypothetical protein
VVSKKINHPPERQKLIFPEAGLGVRFLPA